MMLRDWDAAALQCEKVIEIAPDAVVGPLFRAFTELLRSGDTKAALAALARAPAAADPGSSVTLTKWDISMIERDYAAAAAVLAETPVTTFPIPEAPPQPKSFLEGCTALARGDSAGAREKFEATLPGFEAEVRDKPNDAMRHAYLGLLYAFLGREDDAIGEGRRAVELKPEHSDALTGPQVAALLRSFTRGSGRLTRPWSLIERLLITPGAVDPGDYGITWSYLRLRWIWDPIRGHPRFQKILNNPEPKTIYD